MNEIVAAAIVVVGCARLPIALDVAVGRRRSHNRVDVMLCARHLLQMTLTVASAATTIVVVAISCASVIESVRVNVER